MIDKKTSSRLKQLYVPEPDLASMEPDKNGFVKVRPVAQADTDRGFEIEKGKTIVFTSDELKALRPENSGIAITEFVPASTFPELNVEKTYYLAPAKGADKSYLVLLHAMKRNGVIAVGQHKTSGRDNLFVVRVIGNDLVMHYMYYANEIRAFTNTCTNVAVSDVELKLADQLVAALKEDTYDASKYQESYLQEVRSAAERKLAGEEAVVSSANAPAAFTSLADALTNSLKKKADKKAAPVVAAPVAPAAAPAPAKKRTRKAS